MEDKFWAMRYEDVKHEHAFGGEIYELGIEERKREKEEDVQKEAEQEESPFHC